MNYRRHEYLQSLLAKTIVDLCRAEAAYIDELKIEGTICIVSDSSSVVIAHITESVFQSAAMQNESQKNGYCMESLSNDTSVNGAVGKHRKLQSKQRQVCHENSIDAVKSVNGKEDAWCGKPFPEFKTGNAVCRKTSDGMELAQPPAVSAEIVCPLCGMLFISSSTLQGHLQQCANVNSSDDLVCSICRETFPCLSSLNYHSSHVHQFTSCDNAMDSDQLDQHDHSSNVEDVKPVVGTETENILAMPERPNCSETYSNSTVDNVEDNDSSMVNALSSAINCNSSDPSVMNVRQFFDEIPYMDEMDSSFRISYRCISCSATYRNRSNLQEHVNMHLGKRPHVCKHCGLCFVHRSSLHNHVHSKHSIKTRAEKAASFRHNCVGCGRRFRFPSELMRHNSKNCFTKGNKL